MAKDQLTYDFETLARIMGVSKTESGAFPIVPERAIEILQDQTNGIPQEVRDRLIRFFSMMTPGSPPRD